MRRRTRQVLIAVAAVVAVAALTALVVLRAGRPLYYTDGGELVRADLLSDRPMALWDRPVPVAELPGPVRGRVARLPDGRLLYGRARGETRTELVVYDPAQPALEPVPLRGVDHPGHDLSPALTSDGDLLFASDRDGGEGGFDLYVAVALGEGRFGPPAPLRSGINSPGDELDPAPAPDGEELVFVRRAPDGRGARLWLADRASDAAPRQVFAEPEDPRERLVPVIDREPAFATDGGVLWFVRERQGDRKAVMSAVRHRGQFAPPVRDPVLSGSDGAFRAPLPGTDVIAVVRDGETALWCRAPLRLVQPWWAGQAALERALFVALLVSLLLLALLLLGARWRALDVVTWCILASVLIHLLLWLLLEGIPLATRPVDLPSGPDRMVLSVLGAGEARAQESGGGARTAIAARAERPSHEADLAARAPASALASAPESAPETAPVGERPEAALEPSRAASQAALADAPDSPEASGVRDTLPSSVAGVAPATPAEPGATAPERRTATQDALPAVAAPATTGGLPQAASVAPGTRAGRRPDVRVEPADRGPPPASVADRPTTAPVAEGRAEPLPGPLAAQPTVAAAPVSTALPTAPMPEAVGAPAADGLGAVVAPASALAAGSRQAILEVRGVRPGALARSGTATGPRTDVSDPLDVPTGPVAGAGTRDAEAVPAAATVDVPDAVARPSAVLAAPHPRPVAGELSAPPASRVASSSLPAPTRALRPGSRVARLDDLPAGRRAASRAALDDAGDAPTARARATSGAPLASAIAAPPSPSPRRPTVARPERSEGAAAVASIDRPVSSLPRAPLRPWTRRTGPARVDVLDLYGNRFGPRKAEAIERFGGSAETEAAVARGLDYLASIQNRRGHWGRRSREHEKYGETWVGKTGLCLLAFLGAGHLPEGRTRHAGTAARAVDALLRSQHDDTGHFGVSSAYSHGIATYALAECYAMTKDERLRPSLERAVAWIVQNQDRGRDPRSRGGWGYYSPFLEPEDGYARSSVTAWQLMALESAQLSGIRVEDGVVESAKDFLRRMFDERRGYFLYSKDPSRLRSSWRTLPASTPAATFCLLLLGEDVEDTRIQAGLDYVIERRPKRWERASEDGFVLRADGNPYFWYYGTLASFLAGGDTWTRWNDALKATVLPGQNDDGSFTPIGAYASYADDRRGDYSYTTALAVLSLEVYYRYFTPLLVGR